MTRPTTLSEAAAAMTEASALERRVRTRRPIEADVEWVSRQEYCRRHSIERRTLLKWMRHGMVTYYAALVPGERKPTIRVKDEPPTSGRGNSSEHRVTSSSILDATG